VKFRQGYSIFIAMMTILPFTPPRQIARKVLQTFSFDKTWAGKNLFRTKGKFNAIVEWPTGTPEAGQRLFLQVLDIKRKLHVNLVGHQDGKK